MIPLEFLDCFVEIDDAVQEGEYVCAESDDILHGPVVGIEYGQ
jgi:hypothetical protein